MRTSEHLMPLKYSGSKLGISVAVYGLSPNKNYKKITIKTNNTAIDVRQTGDYTEAAVFEEASLNTFYDVTVTIETDEETFSFACKVIPSEDEANSTKIFTKHFAGGMPPRPQSPRRKAF